MHAISLRRRPPHAASLLVAAALLGAVLTVLPARAD